MTWVQLSPGAFAAHDGYFTYVMVRSFRAGTDDRWDVTRVRGAVAAVLAREQPSAQCRALVREAIGAAA